MPGGNGEVLECLRLDVDPGDGRRPETANGGVASKTGITGRLACAPPNVAWTTNMPSGAGWANPRELPLGRLR